jgi:hypothetical protein
VFVAVSTTAHEYNDGRHPVNVSKTVELTERFIKHKLCQDGIRLCEALRMSAELPVYCLLFLPCLTLWCRNFLLNFSTPCFIKLLETVSKGLFRNLSQNSRAAAIQERVTAVLRSIPTEACADSFHKR